MLDRCGAKLQLVEMTPARGSGSASIQLNDVTILTNPVWDGLRDIAARVSEFYQLPLEVHTYPDE